MLFTLVTSSDGDFFYGDVMSIYWRLGPIFWHHNIMERYSLTSSLLFLHGKDERPRSPQNPNCLLDGEKMSHDYLVIK